MGDAEGAPTRAQGRFMCINKYWIVTWAPINMAGLDKNGKKSALLFFLQPRGAHSPTAELQRDRINRRTANFFAARLAPFPAYGLMQ
jgi:hypothetical protein